MRRARAPPDAPRAARFGRGLRPGAAGRGGPAGPASQRRHRPGLAGGGARTHRSALRLGAGGVRRRRERRAAGRPGGPPAASGGARERRLARRARGRGRSAVARRADSRRSGRDRGLVPPSPLATRHLAARPGALRARERVGSATRGAPGALGRRNAVRGLVLGPDRPRRNGDLAGDRSRGTHAPAGARVRRGPARRRRRGDRSCARHPTRSHAGRRPRA